MSLDREKKKKYLRVQKRHHGGRELKDPRAIYDLSISPETVFKVWRLIFFYIFSSPPLPNLQY